MSEIKAAPLSPGQREEILRNRCFPAQVHIDGALGYIAYLEEQIKVKDEALQADHRLSDHFATCKNGCDVYGMCEEGVRLDREATHLVAAALGQTHQEGTK